MSFLKTICSVQYQLIAILNYYFFTNKVAKLFLWCVWS